MYDDIIKKASVKYNIPENLIKAVITAESSWNTNATSTVGAGGLMQLMPSTAASLGVSNVYDPEQNIMGGTKYLADAIKINNGSVPLALASYNAGQGAVNKYGGVPPYAETQNYVTKIMTSLGVSDWKNDTGLDAIGGTFPNDSDEKSEIKTSGIGKIVGALFTVFALILAAVFLMNAFGVKSKAVGK